MEVVHQQEKGTNQFVTDEEPDFLQDAEQDARTTQSLLYSASFWLASTIGYVISVRGPGASEFIEDSLYYGGSLVEAWLFLLSFSIAC